jgi:diguanylate cyclase (GGDEF)-like protein
METLALHDPLTDLQNRRGFLQTTAQEVNRIKRYGHPFSIAYVDIDNFALVNDQYGHKGGDDVLRKVAEALRRNLRVTDTVARLDGDEFALLLPLTDTRQVPFVIDKVRAHLRSVQQAGGWPVTFSIGVVSFVRAPLSVDEAITLADDAMYAAKKNGKDSVCYTRWE